MPLDDILGRLAALHPKRIDLTLDRMLRILDALDHPERKLPPVYNRASLEPANKAKWEAEGRKPHWRFKLSRSKVSWTELVRGPVEIDTATMSDPVLVREDGAFLYTLPSVADDINMTISHVVRGEDHVTNTAA